VVTLIEPYYLKMRPGSGTLRYLLKLKFPSKVTTKSIQIYQQEMR
jgi:hypothetical protein